MAKRQARGEAAAKKATGGKKSAVRRKPLDRTKARQRTKTAARKTSGKKSAARKRTTPRTATRRGRDIAGSAPSRSEPRGLGPEPGGQSGDTEGFSRAELADSESVEELLEEGQAFEAGIISGVETAGIADKGGVRTRQVPVDDVPQEYLDED